MTLHRFFTLTLACSALAITACGDDGGSNDDTNGDTTGGSTETTPTSDPSTTTVDPSTTGIQTTGLDTTDGTDDSDDTTEGETSDTGLEGCEGEGLGSDVPTQVQGSNVGADDDHQAPCGGRGGRDVVYLWTAPAAGFYSVDTLQSNYDTVLYSFAGGCDGELLACNDDADGSLQSRIVLDLEQGQTVALVVDAFASDDVGNYVLSISELEAPSCPDVDLGNELPLSHAGTTVGGGDDYGSCAGIGSGSEDVSLTWTAPTSALYRFDTFGSSFDTVLTVADSCSEAFAGGGVCNDDFGNSLQSAVFHPMDEGASVVIVVDGYDDSGPYQLNIESVPTEGDCCDATANQNATCEDAETTACVCSIWPECCTSEWSQICVGFNNYFCGGQCDTVAGGSCCTASATPGCDVALVADCVCSFDPFCCEAEWDADCVDAAVLGCAAACN